MVWEFIACLIMNYHCSYLLVGAIRSFFSLLFLLHKIIFMVNHNESSCGSNFNAFFLTPSSSRNRERTFISLSMILSSWRKAQTT